MAFESGSELEGAHKLKMDRTSEEDDGRVGEAAGGERRRSGSPGGVGRSNVSAEDAWEEAWEEA